MTSGERKAAAETIRSFLDGKGGSHDWDEFISVRKKDLNHQLVRDFCADSDLLYPSGDDRCWCGNEGEARLRELAALLDSRAPFNAIRRFMEEERRRAADEPTAVDATGPGKLGHATITLPVCGVCVVFLSALIPPLARIGVQAGSAVVYLSVPFAVSVAVLSWKKNRDRAWTAIGGLGIAGFFAWQLLENPIHP